MARGDNILQRIVRLIFDRAAAERAEKQAKNSATAFDRAFGKIKTAALAMGAAIGAALAVRRIVEFGKASVREAAAAEQSWTRLAQSVDNAGGSFAGIERAVKLAAATLQATTRFGDEDFAESMATIVQVTGDVATGFDLVSVAADLAAAKKMELTQASRLVGLAAIGETGQFKELGIVVEEGADAVEVLRTQFRGFAEREGRTLGGQLDRLNNGWSDFKEAIGEAIIEAGNGTSVLDTLTATVKTLTEWVENDGAQAFRALAKSIELSVRAIVATLEFAGKAGNFLHRLFIWDKDALDARNEALDAIDMVRKANAKRELEELKAQAAAEAAAKANAKATEEQIEAAQKAAEEAEKRRRAEIDAITDALGLRTLTAKDIARARELEAQITAELARGNVELERRNQLIREQTALRNVTLSGPPQAPLPSPTLAPVGRGRILAPTAGDNASVIAEGLTEAARARDEFFAENVDRARESADLMTDAFQTFFDNFIAGLQASNNAFESLAMGFVGIGRFIVSQLIEGWAESQVAMGTAKLASGTWPPNPAAIKAASLHFLAAGLFKAVSGAFAGSGGGRGGGSLPSGSRLPTESTFGGERDPGNVTIILQGEGFDAVNPRVQAVVYEAQRYAEERYGSRGRVIRTGR